jgi:hypothetical protein
MIYKAFEVLFDSLPLVEKPTRPAVFLKTVEELSLEELQVLPSIKQSYTEQLASYAEAKVFNQNEKVAILNDFRKALAEEYGETLGTVREHYIWERASAEKGFYDKEVKYSELSEVPNSEVIHW